MTQRGLNPFPDSFGEGPATYPLSHGCSLGDSEISLCKLNLSNWKRAIHAVSGTVCRTSSHQLRLSLFSGFDSKPTVPVRSFVHALTDAYTPLSGLLVFNSAIINKLYAGGRHDMPRPGLQVVTRWIGHHYCMSMLACQYNQPKRPGDLDLWPFDLESGRVSVTWVVGYLSANF